ncbi:MAG: biotin--[acetyl-CoA-carboxylase] ligase [Peptococcaceae bacterium]|jgi:BirA family biotin operon repressor/biotin-[acetyl-CoA-carboxylase] ligase|nr:biotin--[acetyl-CoA-carboxylase] ligase [Peptococcaceae bacterium]
MSLFWFYTREYDGIGDGTVDQWTEESVIRGLNTRKIGVKCLVLEETGSTNDQARRLAEAGAEEGTVVLAERQLQGRGRLGRRWASPQGSGLWFSVILRPEIRPEEAAGVVFLSAAAVCGALKEFTKLPCFLKWPNDILLEGKKICGILAEMNGTSERINHIVVGVGINVNQRQPDFPEELRGKAGSLAMASGVEWDRIALLREVLRSLDREYEDFLKFGFACALSRWRSLCGMFGQQVRIDCQGTVVSGTALDVDGQGRLLVETPNGVERISAGDVSLVKEA